jgi:hypothetical protein
VEKNPHEFKKTLKNFLKIKILQGVLAGYN